MKETHKKRDASKVLVVTIDTSKRARGHEFMALLRRGGKIIPRKSRRTEKQRRVVDALSYPHG